MAGHQTQESSESCTKAQFEQPEADIKAEHQNLGGASKPAPTPLPKVQ